MAKKIEIDDLDIELKRRIAPRRGHGRKILAMAILGLVMCPVFSATAWAWGKRELRRIEEGEGNPREEGRIRAALILAWVPVLQLLVVLLSVAIAALLVYPSFRSGNLRGAWDAYTNILKDLH